MKSLKKLLVIGALAVLFGGFVATTAIAQTEEGSTLRLEAPLEIGSTTLEPGVYRVKVLPGNDRSTLQVTNEDGTKTLATVLAVPHATAATAEQKRTRYLYYPATEGSTQVLRTWFAPDSATGAGYDIVYSRERATELAASANEPVVFYADGTSSVNFSNTKLAVVSADNEVTVYGAPIDEDEPMVLADARELPQTASRLPLFAALGFLFLLIAGGIQIFRSAQA
jgi:hypothetical protein